MHVACLAFLRSKLLEAEARGASKMKEAAISECVSVPRPSPNVNEYVEELRVSKSKGVGPFDGGFDYGFRLCRTQILKAIDSLPPSPKSDI